MKVDAKLKLKMMNNTRERYLKKQYGGTVCDCMMYEGDGTPTLGWYGNVSDD